MNKRQISSDSFQIQSVMSWDLGSKFLRELYKWGSLPLTAYRKGMKSINVKQVVNGQSISNPR